MAQESTGLSFDRSGLERTEDYSESLANDLLDLSIALRRQDLSRVAEYFPEVFEATPFPASSRPPRREVKWIVRHGWEMELSSRRMRREAFAKSLEAFLSHFSHIEDVRLKAKRAEFEPTVPVSGRARIFCFVVGRNRQGQREWVRGYINVRAELAAESSTRGPGPPGARAPSAGDSARAEGSWQIHQWVIESLESMVSEKDLFSEIAAPAGLWADVPAFGEPPNDAFIAHGAAVADVNEDGLLDVLTTGVLGNRLFLNDPAGRFRDVSEETLVLYTRQGTGALFLDYDNDGDQDIFMAAVGEQVLLQNQLRPDGELRFIDASGPAGVDRQAIGFSVVAADVNNDGWTDVYVSSYNLYGQVMPNSWSQATNGSPNLLFINQGDGRFREEAARWGVDDARWSYAAAFADVDGDGGQDLYVVNDFGENALFMNRGDHFRDEALERGVIDPGNGMGVSFGDFDNDGDLDLHVTNMSSTAGNRILSRLMPSATPAGAVLKKLAAGNSLFENLGGGIFRNVAQQAGGFGAGWAYGGGFFDFDNDGWEDEFSVNGFVSGKTMKDT
ncbi:MAG: FG-GAP-like repeat-containing protein [Acidobacteriota bacterium]